MDKPSPFTKRETGFLEELGRNRVRFMIVGLSAAALQGAPVVTQDIDLWFENLKSPGIGKALKKVGGVFVHQIGLNPPMFAGDGVNLFDVVVTMHGLNGFADEWNHTIDVRFGKVKVKVLELDRIIKSKEAVRRPKDLLVLPVLRDVLKTVQAVSRSEKSNRRKNKSHSL